MAIPATLPLMTFNGNVIEIGQGKKQGISYESQSH